MLNTHVAIDPTGFSHRMTEEAIDNLQRLHQDQQLKGWLYGELKDEKKLLNKVKAVNPDTAAKLAGENEELKTKEEKLLARIAELEAEQRKANVIPPVINAGGEAEPALHWKQAVALIEAAHDIEAVNAISPESTANAVVQARSKRIAELEKGGHNG